MAGIATAIAMGNAYSCVAERQEQFGASDHPVLGLAVGLKVTPTGDNNGGLS